MYSTAGCTPPAGVYLRGAESRQLWSRYVRSSPRCHLAALPSHEGCQCVAAKRGLADCSPGTRPCRLQTPSQVGPLKHGNATSTRRLAWETWGRCRSQDETGTLVAEVGAFHDDRVRTAGETSSTTASSTKTTTRTSPTSFHGRHAAAGSMRCR